MMAMWFTTKTWPPGCFKNKRVVELGSGTSVPGMALATLGAHVVLTDRKPLLAGMEANIDANGLRRSARAAELQWGADRGQLDGILQCFRELEAESVSEIEQGVGRLQGAGGEGKGGDGGEKREGEGSGNGEGERSAEERGAGANGTPEGTERSESSRAGTDSASGAPVETQGGIGATDRGTVTEGGTLTNGDTVTAEPGGTASTLTDKEGDDQAQTQIHAQEQVQPQEEGQKEESGAEAESNPYAVDYVIGSDIMFDPESETMVNLSTAIKWLTGKRTRIFMCCELRPPLPECFRHMHDSGLRWKAVPQDQLHPDWSSEDIKIFEFFVGGDEVDEQ